MRNLRAAEPSLRVLLSAMSDHWTYEDSVYRFYHHSYKVFGLQARTEEIHSALRALLPGRVLCPGFLEIIGAGTGKEFRPEQNAHWSEHTRPILEAFFHARFFLEMAVRYSDLSAPPTPLPSGYAALLTLFGLR